MWPGCLGPREASLGGPTVQGGEPRLGRFGPTHRPTLQTAALSPHPRQVLFFPRRKQGWSPAHAASSCEEGHPQSRKLGCVGRNSARISANSSSAGPPLANGNPVIRDREWQTPAPGNVELMYVSVINQRICKRGIKYLIIIVPASLRGGGDI